MFVRAVDLAGVSVNASTRLRRRNMHGLGAEAGINTGGVYARGSIGLERLVKFEYVLTGQGKEGLSSGSLVESPGSAPTRRGEGTSFLKEGYIMREE